MTLPQGNSGDIYEQAVVKTIVGFFYGNSKHLYIWGYHNQFNAEIGKMSLEFQNLPIQKFFLETEQIYIMIIVSMKFLEDVEMTFNQEGFTE